MYLYRIAAKGGNFDAQKGLALLYKKGEGIEKDLVIQFVIIIEDLDNIVLGASFRFKSIICRFYILM
ncbi:unnamed protein product [Rhizophagus irregularis]|nr:unnamed protein product [Rhizophagus irregularis]